MEKLQAAIEKARVKRDAGATAPAPKPETQEIPEPAEPVAAAPSDWAALREFSLAEGRAARNRLFLAAKSPEASYFDKLRTKILQRCKDNGWTRMIVTSGSKGCGKTTMATNLAASFSRQRDRKLILLDLDMRRPGVASQLGQTGRQGIADVLEGHATFEDVAVRFGDNVAIGMSFGLHPNPAQLILRDRTPAILDEIQARYAPDLMIIDSPPILATDDTTALLKYVDCALIVAAAEETTTDEVDTVEKEIAEVTNVMGVVLNKCLYSDPSHSYYAY